MIFANVRRMMAEITGAGEEEIAPGTHLSRSNGVDATALAKLVMKCEHAFRVTIPDEDAAFFGDVGDLVSAIEEKLADGREDYVAVKDDDRTAWYYE